MTEPGRGSQRVGDATAEEPAQAAAPTRRVAAATSGFTVLIGGRPRAGKSRLAARLSDEFGWPVVNGDLLRAALRAPDCGGLRPLHARNATARALLAYGKQRVGTSKIIDGEQFSPSAVAKHHDPAHWVVAFLGFPRIGIEQLLGRIRDYEFIHKGWTTEKTDDELREACSQWIEAGVAEKAACERLGLTFVDTSKNFDASIDRAFDDLCAAIRRMIDHGTVA